MHFKERLIVRSAHEIKFNFRNYKVLKIDIKQSWSEKAEYFCNELTLRIIFYCIRKLNYGRIIFILNLSATALQGSPFLRKIGGSVIAAGAINIVHPCFSRAKTNPNWRTKSLDLIVNKDLYCISTSQFLGFENVLLILKN